MKFHPSCAVASAFIAVISVTATTCKSRERTLAKTTADVPAPEILKDPNPIASPFDKDREKFLLATTTTPCVSQISYYGSYEDRGRRESFSRAVMQRI